MSYLYPFVVYLTVYSGNQLPPFYIGSTSLVKIKKGYRGSPYSKQYREIWRRELKHNPHLFTTRIVSLHKTRSEAANKESKIQSQLNVTHNSLYINKAYWLGGHLNYGRSHTKEARLKMSRSRKGKYRGLKQSQEHIDRRFAKIRQDGKVVTTETRQKISNSLKGNIPHNKGKVMPEYLKQNLSLKRQKYKFILKDKNDQLLEVDHLMNFCREHNFTAAQISNLRGNFRKNLPHRSNGYKIVKQIVLDHI